MKYSLSFRIKSYFKYALNMVFDAYAFKLYLRKVAAKRKYKEVNADKYMSDDAENIVWIYYPNEKLREAQEPWDILLMAYIASCGEKFKIHNGLDIGQYHNKRILYSINKDKINLFNLENYSSFYQLVSKELENQGNQVYPTHHDILYWENKVYMYQRFAELGINTPRTVIYDDFEKVIAEENNFPFLIKIAHSSGSYGMFNVTDKDCLTSLRNDDIIKANKYYIIQQRLNITEDMRVIFVGDQIVHYYWRKNKDKSKWKTTSTSNGSSVDFEYFPEQWRSFLNEQIGRLGIIMGACDIGWQNDDVNAGPPYFFEVSPSYDINPKITHPDYLADYGAWKKKLLLKGSFDRLFVESTYDIKQRGVAEFFKRIKEKPAK